MASTKGGDSDGGSLTPSDGSESDEVSERDSDYGSDDENLSKPTLNIQWTGYAKKTPIIIFNSECIFNKRLNMRTVGERYHMAYKFGNSQCKVVRDIFNSHGFHEVHPNSSDYNLVWTGAHLKPFTLRGLSEFQKINHFPRSYELTRKDRLFKNIQRMQQVKGYKHFDIVPNSFVLPGEYQEFCTAFLKDKGPWIVKPVASSRGRGIFLVNHPDQIPLDENIVVCRYLHNPLLIDGFKFDVRLYVAVTSYDPLSIYLFEEGLTRFASVKYEKSGRHIRNHFMHLTNYSVNKKNEEYVKNDDADVEDYGNKWSLGAMLRYLRSNGKDTAALMMKIEDVIIKTLISVELPIATACKMFMPFRGNCFELYGFDILIDDNMKPWVLEVNLSPSLACESPLDLKIKGNMLCDLFSLTGIMCHDPMMRTMQQSRRNMDVTSKMAARAKSARVRTAQTILKQRPSSAGSMKKGSDGGRDPSSATNKSMAGLNSEEIRVLRRIKEEDARKGGWVRIFPTADSWDLYSSFLQFTTTHNVMVHQKLYPERHKSVSTSAVTGGSTSAGSRAKSAYIQLANNSIKPTAELAAAYGLALLRTKKYERKLGNARCRNRRRRKTQNRKAERRKLVQGVAEDSPEENEDNEEDNEDDEVPITERNISERNNQLSKRSQEDQTPLEKGAQKLKTEDVIQIVVEKDSKSDLKNERRSGGGLAALARNKTDSDTKSGVGKQGDNYTEEEGRGVPPPPPDSPPPPIPPPETKYNVVELLKKGHTLSKVQARTAFAMYLVRVQQRLMTESTSLSQDDVDGLNEQMDLVLRFLKRAAVNLQQSFKVVVPSRKLPLNDRRRILAKQLGDFVHIYNKETEQLRSRRQMERKHTTLRRAESLEGLEDDKFDRFVHTASEAELEEVLTTYTKINKSASIFLGSKTGEGSPDSVTPQHIPTTGNSMKHVGATSSSLRQEAGRQEAGLLRRKDSVSDSGVPDPKTGWEDVPKAIHSVPTSSSDLRHQHTPSNPSNHHGSVSSGPNMRNSPAVYSSNSAASYASAVQIYTQKLSTLRPRSASTGGQKQDKQIRNRPSSASVARPSSAVNSAYGSTPDLQGLANKHEERNSSPSRSPIHFSKHFARSQKDPYNEKVISEALQRLTMRQQARQYSAFNGTSLVPSNSRPTSASGPREPIDEKKAWSPLEEKGGGDGKLVTMEDYISKHRPPSGHAQKRVHSAIDIKTFEGQRRKQTNVNLQSANATFNSFIEDTGPNWPNELALAYSQVTGVTPQNYHSPTYSSKQYQILQQQALKQQSKVLLEQSKAKHQAMIAQAHAVQKSLTRPDSDTMLQMYAPKPPVNPSSRKSASAHHRMSKRTPDETGLSFQFSSSAKPQVNGGW